MCANRNFDAPLYVKKSHEVAQYGCEWRRIVLVILPCNSSFYNILHICTNSSFCSLHFAENDHDLLPNSDIILRFDHENRRIQALCSFCHYLLVSHDAKRGLSQTISKEVKIIGIAKLSICWFAIHIFLMLYNCLRVRILIKISKRFCGM